MAAAEKTVDRRVARVPCGIDAPAHARRWVAGRLEAVDPGTTEAVVIAVSELVTNAVVHAGLVPGAPIDVRVEVRWHRVTLSVRDRGAGLPPAAPRGVPDPDEQGSRGLPLVGRLADRVLIDPAAGAVTCEFRRPAAPRPPP